MVTVMSPTPSHSESDLVQQHTVTLDQLPACLKHMTHTALLVNFTLQQYSDPLRSLQLYTDTLWRVVSITQRLLNGHCPTVAQPLPTTHR
jgi:hypothetical protein